ncbi:histidine--tRNA ligase [Wohlfahrtiimonas chitiniclastica]|uniref:histidine--tRNA ligase n=1 Tax=Wohlfahrtiimonas chitiniclastica TaxID=400946 RepID=UPI000B999994|nr:histidine--tRNA ligase [Wohlfahrtiimonas chitiniclastica]MBS7816594.1 histidine--tRNA ligase [Wohlfahrtiimonas chitiniclastica]MBS7822489.1 histidine--tRNA ligase [Wohlfahrtiimonas chitiniclastica]MBS7830052.1 histidine--tRNA ligase [Wohlfahrtiimonas chitiniclastica]MBS7832156.1 histidine--tRNA ligase [Wohlfahrtiimonas chitiniclastica]OYQ77862.1 histidine--tRNA ligase [Wohlfahrtiimonas chitiniclastica]
MGQKIQSVKGMHDALPTQTAKWQYIESLLRHLFAQYGYREIRTPIVEETRLFTRSLGEVTDIVEKEMYIFADSDEKTSLALRPELTAGIVRSGIQHGLFYNQVQKVWQIGSVFRYDKPQHGRYRQFNQADIEVFGIETPDADAEILAMINRLWQQLGVADYVTLEINSMGTEECRKRYRDVIVKYFEDNIELLDEDSLRRLKSNPLRILDSKNPAMQALLNNAPKLLDHLTEDSAEHFKKLCQYLDELGIQYVINHRIVRGMDYYTRTVFEWTTDKLGAQATICGGGRYDRMVEELGGHKTPAIGFGLGMERLYLLCEEVEGLSATHATDLVAVLLGQDAKKAGLPLMENIRSAYPNYLVTTVLGEAGMKSQMKKADQSGARYAMILGENELNNGIVIMKDLRQSGEQTEVAMTDVIDWLKNIQA